MNTGEQNAGRGMVGGLLHEYIGSPILCCEFVLLGLYSHHRIGHIAIACMHMFARVLVRLSYTSDLFYQSTAGGVIVVTRFRHILFLFCVSK